MASKDDVKQDKLVESLGQTTLSPTSSPQSSSKDTQLLNNSDSHNNHNDSSSSASISNGIHDDSNTKDHPGITFATTLSDTASDSKDSLSQGLVRRKSSLSSNRRASTSEKHVTIVDTPGDKASEDGTHDGPEQSSETKTEADEETRQELSKILQQFDPLVESKQKKDEENIKILDKGIDVNISGSALLLSVKSSGSKTSKSTTQNLTLPKNSHDISVTTSENPKPSSSKKKSDSKNKSLNGEKESSSSRSNSTTSAQSKPKEAQFDFQKFMDQMRHRSATPIARYFHSFMKEFERKPWNVNEQIKIIHDFLDFIAGKMELCDLWKNSTDQEFENAKEGMEKLVMNRLFTHAFSPSTTDDAERDEVLSQKINIFRWVKEEHLDIPHSPYNETNLENAQKELAKINSFKSPRDKVICILNCCKYIFALIRRAEGNSKGADTFLPILIFVVLRSNPPNLVSNVQYISRFRNPDKLQAEAGYYLASLMGAISFIENLEAGSLSISPEEFDKQIEKTMNELNKEKLAQEEQSRSTTPEPPAPKQSKLATLVAGTAATKNSRQRTPIDEKQYLAAESASKEQQVREKSPSRLTSPLGSSILNPAAAIIERGANFATKTIQKPLDLFEKMFHDSGDTEEMAKPYPPRPSNQQQQILGSPPPLPQRDQQQQQTPQDQRPSNPGRGDSFTEFYYVPAGQEVQQPSPQHLNNQGYPNTSENIGQPPPPRQPQPINPEKYLKDLDTLQDMFPSCERQVCDAILQANEGRLSPSIDDLLEISMGDTNHSQHTTQQSALEENSSSLI